MKKKCFRGQNAEDTISHVASIYANINAKWNTVSRFDWKCDMASLGVQCPCPLNTSRSGTKTRDCIEAQIPIDKIRWESASPKISDPKTFLWASFHQTWPLLCHSKLNYAIFYFWWWLMASIRIGPAHHRAHYNEIWSNKFHQTICKYNTMNIIPFY